MIALTFPEAVGVCFYLGILWTFIRFHFVMDDVKEIRDVLRDLRDQEYEDDTDE